MMMMITLKHIKLVVKINVLVVVLVVIVVVVQFMFGIGRQATDKMTHGNGELE